MGSFKLFMAGTILSLSFIANHSLSASSQSNYFSDSCLYSSEDLARGLREKTLDMAWHFGEGSHFRFASRGDEVYFEICLGTLPDIYDDFVSRVKHKFVECANGEIVFAYKVNGEGGEEFNVLQPSQRKTHPNADSYVLTDRRVVESAAAQTMTREQLSRIVEDRRVLFYTGAGLSVASGVPAMSELYNLLGLERGENFLFSLESALENPREFASKILLFHKACLFSAPTKAHIALKELAVFKNIRLITENLDCLHEASGVYPYRIEAKHLREEVGGECLAEFDYVICVGLSYDDRGFLGWYKHHNPEGKIVAIDMHQPSYLGDEDFLLIGDLQEVIPKIAENLISRVFPTNALDCVPGRG